MEQRNKCMKNETMRNVEGSNAVPLRRLPVGYEICLCDFHLVRYFFCFLFGFRRVFLIHECAVACQRLFMKLYVSII